MLRAFYNSLVLNNESVRGLLAKDQDFESLNEDERSLLSEVVKDFADALYPRAVTTAA